MNIIMRSRCCTDTLETLLKECYGRAHCQSVIHRRNYVSKSVKSNTESGDKQVAILGGGITGLASAFYLSEALPNSKIVLYEGSSRLGGWLRSTVVEVEDGEVVFEQGPRTLRPSAPNGLVTLDLIQRLGLEGEVLMTSKNSVAAQNRYLYYPDHLVRMPGPGLTFWEQASSVLTEPVFKGVLSGVFHECVQPQRSRELEDESVGSFISRRFGSSLADNIVSAVYHGIYAGDIYKLSARSILPKLWHYEKEDSSVMMGALRKATQGSNLFKKGDLELISNLKGRMQTQDGKWSLGEENFDILCRSSVFTFKKGIGQLASRLESLLGARKNVKIMKNTWVNSLRRIKEEGIQKIKITPSSYGATRSAGQAPGQSRNFSHVISTLSGKALSALTNGQLSVLSRTPSVTVMVINLFYSNPSLLPVHGFGYLIPRSIALAENPERALGVVFDSDATIGQDSIPGTKVTVMMGGHWWDDWSAYPDEHEGAKMARSILKRHLGITEQPQSLNVGLQRDCIPQYTFGHTARMQIAAEQLETHYRGRLMVAGNSYTGVGLNDCVRAAKDVVDGLISGKGRTGLESFSHADEWQKLSKIK